MPRDYFVNGETLCLVKGRHDFTVNGAAFDSFSFQLGLATDPIRITPNFRHSDITVDAWGQAPADIQWMLADLTVTMNLIHFDPNVLDGCLGCSMGGGAAIGEMGRAGQRMGGGNTPSSFAGVPAGNNYIRLMLSSPGAQKPWTFPSAYLTGPPETFPLGTEKSVVALNWRVVPYVVDPANIVAGQITGATNYPLWLHSLDPT